MRNKPKVLNFSCKQTHCFAKFTICIFRAAVQRKTQQSAPPPQSCSVGASPTTPVASTTVFHTPSPSPTFRQYQPIPETSSQFGYQHLIPQLNNNPVKFGTNGQPSHPYLITTQNPYQPNPVQILGQMKNQIILINNQPYAHHSATAAPPAAHPAVHHHQHHLAQNVQNVFTN